ncbi:acyltransferase domain-containing protein [Paenibacillus sp. GM2FR]|uniref:acyltransferase domain-containing protein n=1 Tax=unclassified Paenibacillus TaxID=185978 RepID=UPI000C26FE52|nr:acyltransferase domain-containing protein [Paenibacillus sp. GM2FR]
MKVGKSIVFLFSGQGSQYYQMGKELYRDQPVFRHWIQKLDQYYYQISGKSVTRELYENNYPISRPFDSLPFTHPAIFMIEYALAQVFMEYQIFPDYVLGTSLGEFASCTVAGSMDYNAALEHVIAQAEIIQNHCEPGGMIAILDQVSLYRSESILYQNCEIASVNFDTHFVISGGVSALSEVESYLRDRNIMAQRLPIRHGFHSKWIDPAGPYYKRHVSSLALKSPHTTVISSFSGQRVAAFEPEYLWNMVREPIRFRDALKSLMPLEDKIFVDLGPGGTLATFIKHNHQMFGSHEARNIHTVLSPFHKDIHRLEQVISKIKMQRVTT